MLTLTRNFFRVSPSDLWKPDEDYWDAGPTTPRPQPANPTADLHDHWPEEVDPAVTDAHEDYWKARERAPSSTPPPDTHDDDLWKTEPSTPAPVIYDDLWKPDEMEPNTFVTDNYDNYWREVETTPSAPQVDGKGGTDDTEYWNAKCTSESLFLPAQLCWRYDHSTQMIPP